jgi:uncharacterized protein (TIGR00303 family)
VLVEDILICDGIVYPDIEAVSATESFKFPSTDTFNPLFLLVISYTNTSHISGITAAGQNKDLIKYTSPADAEFLYHGRCSCIDSVPVTPNGMPTPAIITKAALDMADIPLLVVDAGSSIQPDIPFVSTGLNPGNDIRSGKALDKEHVEKGLRHGELIGSQLAKMSNMIIIGESIPGGTTTALGVLVGLGIDAWDKVSSSLQHNPHALKKEVVIEGMNKADLPLGNFANDPIKVIAAVGDPMIPVVTGLAYGISRSGSHVMLAGGTQMAAILATIRAMNRSLNNLCIGTTRYIAEDHSSDIRGILSEINSDSPIYAADLHFEDSKRDGIRAFSRGFVKEGAGAGGVCIAAMLKSRGSLTGSSILSSIESRYDELMMDKNVQNTLQ